MTISSLSAGVWGEPCPGRHLSTISRDYGRTSLAPPRRGPSRARSQRWPPGMGYFRVVSTDPVHESGLLPPASQLCLFKTCARRTQRTMWIWDLAFQSCGPGAGVVETQLRVMWDSLTKGPAQCVPSNATSPMSPSQVVLPSLLPTPTGEP